jgi:hypothetical protein
MAKEDVCRKAFAAAAGMRFPKPTGCRGKGPVGLPEKEDKGT